MPTDLYCITCLVTDKLYVGITSRGIDTRWKEHCKEAKARARWVISKAIRKYGSDQFKVELLHTYDSPQEAADAEVDLVAHLNLMSAGYNAAPGGDLSPTLGIGHSVETKKLLSEKARMQFSSPEARKMLSDRSRQLMTTEARARIASALRGTRLSEDTKNKIAAAHRGRKNTPATLLKMSEAAKRRWAGERELEVRHGNS